MHATAATTSAITTITTITKTIKSVAITLRHMILKKKIGGNIEGKVELYQNILCAYRLLIRSYQQYFRAAYHIKSTLQGHHEWDVQLTKRQNVPATTAINTAATAVTTNNYG